MFFYNYFMAKSSRGHDKSKAVHQASQAVSRQDAVSCPLEVSYMIVLCKKSIFFMTN